MNIIKKTIKCILLLIIFVFLILPFIGNNIVSASETNNYEVNMENIQNVDDVGYLYNFDGSPDYIYVDFIDQTGYAIFSEETLEILEYTNNGPFPYNSINEQKYYGGPYKYFIKNNNCFKNILTSEEFSFSTDFIEKIASFSRAIFNTTKKTNLEVDSLTAIKKISSNYAISLYDNGTTDSVSLPSSPPLDESNWIIPTGDAIYIDNVEYFMTPSQSPRHGSNNGTSCTTVAIQLLLSYNNYYNDRRIIAPEHLFGGWNTGSSDIFDRSNYTTPDNSPNVCSNPNIITSEIIGSNQAFHDLLFSEQITGFLTDAQAGLEDYLDNRGVDYDIECEMETTLPFDWGSVQTIDSAKITNKIDEGKPVVISTEESLNGTPYTTSTGTQRAFNHSVIAYGYQTLAPYTSSGNSNSYLGYIVHMGWDANGLGNNTNIWTNSSWYYSYLSLDINHNHNYNVVVNNIINNEKIEIRCGECGHRKLDDLFVLSNNTIIDTKYDLVGKITIPSNINGIEVKGIGSEAFKNCKNLQEITIPNSVTHIDSSAFENCSYLQSVTLPTNLVAIGSSAFKGCGSLATITIPNGVTNIDSNAFENCSYLQSVTLPTNLVAIGSSAFKGCGSLASITIPNGVTNIDSSAFENCSYLQSVTLPTNLVAIGISAFKGCGSLGSITIPSNVQYIDDSAFENCVSLVSVVVERGISNITNLGNYAFAGCSSTLQIIVPKNRIAEYKNKVYWSSYKNIIIPDNDNYDEIDLYCLIDDEKSVTLNAGYNKLYKLVVDCTKSYKFVTDTDTKINIYNLDMTNAYSGENTLIAYLNKGTYYLSIEYSSVTASGTININYELTYPTDGIAIAYNSSNGTNIASGLHLTENNMYHARLKYTNYNGAGFYKFTLNAGASAIYPANAIQVYTDANRNNLLSIYSLSEVNKFAQSNENENIMYIYLPENGTYYIDVTLPLSSYPILTFNIQSIEVNNINYLNSLTSIGFDVLFESENTQSRFEEVTISHRSEIQLDILTNGTINNNIKVYVLEKVRDPGYEPGINYYYIESIYIDEITSTNRGPVFTIVLDPGTYYFGYAENEDNVNINFALRRMVDYDMNMQGVLVADPYYTGYDLGTEVLFNSGECDEYTITEGFTRNIYLMVEDRLRDPMSRLDYDWYSSNESVATVTNYGTILAMPVTEDTEVTIYAVLKDDPKIVYYRTFTVLNDVEEDLIEIELNMSYSYATKNGTYQLELTNTNCPYPMIQYYSWNIINDSDETVTMNNWGEITSTGRCTVLIEGTYNLNSRVRLYITLIIE